MDGASQVELSGMCPGAVTGHTPSRVPGSEVHEEVSHQKPMCYCLTGLKGSRWPQLLLARAPHHCALEMLPPREAAAWNPEPASPSVASGSLYRLTSVFTSARRKKVKGPEPLSQIRSKGWLQSWEVKNPKLAHYSTEKEESYIIKNATDIHEDKLKAFVKTGVYRKSTTHFIPKGETEVFNLKSKQDRPTREWTWGHGEGEG